ncbi:MAG: DUF4129 domain-containing protein [Firmicutes bacterium]|nr:DUF4129 domain-containing protein [Bacillota bacterium]
MGDDISTAIQEESCNISLPAAELTWLGLVGATVAIIVFHLAILPLSKHAYPWLLSLLILPVLAAGFAITREVLEGGINPGLRVVEILLIAIVVRVMLLINADVPLSRFPHEILWSFLRPRRLISLDQIWYTLGILLYYSEICQIADNMYRAQSWFKPGAERDNFLFESCMRAAKRLRAWGFVPGIITCATLAVDWYIRPESFSWQNGWCRQVSILSIFLLVSRISHRAYVDLLVGRLEWDYEGIDFDTDVESVWRKWLYIALGTGILGALVVPKITSPFSIRSIIEFMKNHPPRLNFSPPPNLTQQIPASPPPNMPGPAGQIPEIKGLGLLAWMQIIISVLLSVMAILAVCALVGALLSFILRTETARSRLIPRILIRFYILTRLILLEGLGTARRFINRSKVGGIISSIRVILAGITRFLKPATSFIFGGRRRYQDGRPEKEISTIRSRMSLAQRAGDTLIEMFISLVDHASAAGIERKPYDTALEFSSKLKTKMPEVAEDIETLTSGFLESRYGQKEATSGRVGALKLIYRRILDSLQRLGV